jgi:hypothetical protein
LSGAPRRPRRRQRARAAAEGLSVSRICQGLDQVDPHPHAALLALQPEAALESEPDDGQERPDGVAHLAGDERRAGGGGDADAPSAVALLMVRGGWFGEGDVDSEATIEGGSVADEPVRIACLMSRS